MRIHGVGFGALATVICWVDWYLWIKCPCVYSPPKTCNCIFTLIDFIWFIITLNIKETQWSSTWFSISLLKLQLPGFSYFNISTEWVFLHLLGSLYAENGSGSFVRQMYVTVHRWVSCKLLCLEKWTIQEKHWLSTFRFSVELCILHISAMVKYSVPFFSEYEAIAYYQGMHMIPYTF